jgi:acetate kinase
VRVLTVNAGSSTLKLAVLDGADNLMASEALEATGGAADAEALSGFLVSAGPVDAVGHRIVHGGARFLGPVSVDGYVLGQLEALSELAPLHQPRSLAALRQVSALLPGIPAVACFDTAFHAGMPPGATTYALPAAWRERFGLRRFGFHGLSHAYAARRAAELLGRPAPELRLVTCHLGAGASLAAVVGGRSVDTTMGFTPLDGLVMATRSGSVDPGLVLWLIERAGLPPAEVAEALEQRSGLAALAGTGDMRQVIERAGTGDTGARLGLEVYLHRLRAGMAAMTAAMAGLDAVVFTGGIGEHAPLVRAGAADGLGFLGLAIDPALNEQAGGTDRLIGVGATGVAALVVSAREDLQLARETRTVLNG